MSNVLYTHSGGLKALLVQQKDLGWVLRDWLTFYEYWGVCKISPSTEKKAIIAKKNWVNMWHILVFWIWHFLRAILAQGACRNHVDKRGWRGFAKMPTTLRVWVKKNDTLILHHSISNYYAYEWIFTYP